MAIAMKLIFGVFFSNETIKNPLKIEVSIVQLDLDLTFLDLMQPFQISNELINFIQPCQCSNGLVRVISERDILTQH